jgi:dUTP pyrophosphatase
MSAPAVHIAYLPNAADLYGSGGLTYATEGSVGLDLRACFDADTDEVFVEPGGRIAVPTGIAIAPQIPDIAGFVYSRSGLGAKQGLTVAQGVGVIDPDYRGEIIVFLLNTSDERRRIGRGDRIAQLVFQPVCRVRLEQRDALDETARGAGGFGHTGN